MSALFEVRLLGRPSFSYDGAPFAFTGPPRALPLLAYLASRAGEPIAREMLAVLLWPDADDATARANLRRHVHVVLKALPPAPAGNPWIVTTATTLAWNARSLHEIDVATFERLSASADRRDTVAAVGRYGGEFLEGLEDDWIAERRGRLAMQQLANLERLIAQAIATNDAPEALVYAQMMLAADPWREDAVRHVIRLKNAVGDRSGALVAYEKFTSRLRDEVGVDPMPETTAEYKSAMRGAEVSLLVAEAEPHIGAAVVASEAPFVGREIERRTLDTALSRLARGHGGAVLLGGEAGIGKTRLTDAFIERAAAQEMTILRAYTTPREAMPYEGPAALLAAAIELLPAGAVDEVHYAALASLVPALARREPPLPELVPLEGERDRRRLFDAAARVFAAVAERKPLAIVLEDMHWSGAASVALFTSLVEDLADKRVLFLATCRDEEIERGHPLREARRRLSALPNVQRMALGPLTRGEIEKLIASFVPAAERVSLAQSLAERTDGNPFFLTELVRNRRESGTTDDALPASVRETILARLGRLSERARGVADFGAIVGRAFDVDLVREIAGWSEHDVLTALDELIDRRVVRDLGTQANYAFVHQLIPATIEETMDPALARRRHRRVAIALEELAGADRDPISVELARHFERGGEAARAAEYFLISAKRAAEVFAHDDAVVFATRALAATSDKAIRCAALLLRESAARVAGDRERQLADLDELESMRLDDRTAFEIARRRVELASVINATTEQQQYVGILAARARALGTENALAAADEAEGHYALVKTDYDRANRKLEVALRRFRALDDHLSALRCMEALVRIANQQARQDVVDRLLVDADAINMLTDNASVCFVVAFMRCQADFARSDWDSVTFHADAALTAARRCSDALNMARSLEKRAEGAAWRFDVRSARADYAEAIVILERLGDKLSLLRCVGGSANLESRTGRFAVAIAQYERQIELARAIGHPFGEAVAYVNLTWCAATAENLPRAAEAGQKAVEMASSIDSVRMQVEARVNFAVVERARGRFAQALSLMEEALTYARSRAVMVDLIDTLAQLTETYRCVGRMADARRVAEELLVLLVDAERSIVHPQMAYWYASQAFAIADPARALALAHRAHSLMMVRAAAIPDAESQANYFVLPYNREIRERVGERQHANG